MTPPAPEQQASAATVQRWEYKLFQGVETFGLLGEAAWTEDGVRIPTPGLRTLNARGAEGWELVSVTSVADRNPATGGTILRSWIFLRRPLPQ